VARGLRRAAKPIRELARCRLVAGAAHRRGGGGLVAKREI